MAILKTRETQIAPIPVIGNGPLTEGIVKRRRRPNGFFSKMTDEELLGFARKFLADNRISSKAELGRADQGLFYTLYSRKLLNSVGFEVNFRQWGSLSDDEIVERARELKIDRGIGRRSELAKEDGGLYTVLIRRSLMENVGFEKWQMDLASKTDDELVGFAREAIKERKISGRTELCRTMSKLYDALRKRKLLDKLGFEEKYRKWTSMSDDELAGFAKRFIEEKKIGGRKELEKADVGLYCALKKRKLLGGFGREEKKRGWSGMSDDKLVEHAQNFMDANGVRWRKDLAKVDGGMYNALVKRKLINRVHFEKERRSWASLSEKELVEHARTFLKENGISSKHDLKKADRGLHLILRKKKLIDEVFSLINSHNQSRALAQIIESVREFNVF